MINVESASSQSLLDRAAHGHRSTLLSQGLRLFCKLASVLVLARLVSPNDHGLFAMASSVVLLLALFRDAGLGIAAVQAPALDATQRNALFWAQLALGGILALTTLGLAPATARFYAAPEVAPLLALMSISFLLIGAGGFARSQLAREARFTDVNRVENAAAVLGTIAMIIAAVAGAAAYSFAVFLLVSEAVATTVAWRTLAWRPHSRPSWGSLRGLLRTGADVTAYQCLGYILQQLDTVIVGRWFGAHSVGLYNRSNQLLALPGLYVVTPLSQVTLVTLSRLGADSSHFDQHAQKTATVIAHLILPLFAVCIILPAETVRLILGAHWPDAAPLLRLLAIAAAAAAITSLGYAVNVAMGRTRLLVSSAAFALPFTALAIWIGARHGALGVAAGIAIVNVALAPPRLWWALHELPGGLAGYFRALVGPFIAMGATLLGLCAGSEFASEHSWFVRLLTSVASGAVALTLVAALSPQLRREWRWVFEYLPKPAWLEKGDS